MTAPSTAYIPHCLMGPFFLLRLLLFASAPLIAMFFRLTEFEGSEPARHVPNNRAILAASSSPDFCVRRSVALC